MVFSKEPPFELPIALPPRRSRDLSRSLYLQLRTAIVDSRLQQGVSLPATRAFAAMLGVSRNTVLAAYQALLRDGYLSSRPGSGTYVSPPAAVTKLQRSGRASPTAQRPLNPIWKEASKAWVIKSNSAAPPNRFDYQLGMPDKLHFPFEVWKRLSARSLRTFARAPIAKTDPQGQQELREAIARHLSFARAVSCNKDHIVVTAGAQQGFDLLARTLVVAGHTTVALEEPGYPKLRQAFMAAGAKIAPIRVDDEGLMVDKIPEDARIICVTPSHQFPLGVTMSLRRRASLLEFARARGAVIVEDDYDGEFRLGGHPVDALKTLDTSDCVVYVGTFSKSLYPAIRLGFLLLPPWAMPPILAAKQVTDLYSSLHAQDTLAAFIGEGHLAKHVRRMRRLYEERRRLLCGLLQEHFSGVLQPIVTHTGLHLTAGVRSLRLEDTIVATASQQGISLQPLRRFFYGRASRAGIVFGYGAISPQAIEESLQLLRRRLRDTAG